MSSRSSSASEGPPPKRVGIVQSSYIAWKGYFDLIASVDEFILLDDVQYTRRDWRNRNRIKTAQGVRWLTIPVRSKGNYRARIDEIEVGDTRWAERHFKTLAGSYSAAPCFPAYRDRVEKLYADATETSLSAVNHHFITALCGLLGIQTRLSRSTDYHAEGHRGDRLLDLCRRAGATEYRSGPAARAYLDERRFADAGIAVSYMDYSGYPEYPQVHPPFEHRVTVLDLLFHAGDDAPRYMKSLTEVSHAK